LYVADLFNRRIQKFERTGDFVCEWDGDYDLDGPTARPNAVVVDNQNNVYVNAITRIEKFYWRGRFLGHVDNVNIWDIAIESQANLYMTDVENSRIV
jgi:hypothetical protein